MPRLARGVHWSRAAIRPRQCRARARDLSCGTVGRGLNICAQTHEDCFSYAHRSLFGFSACLGLILLDHLSKGLGECRMLLLTSEVVVLTGKNEIALRRDADLLELFKIDIMVKRFEFV